jgi:hypothetical protein
LTNFSVCKVDRAAEARALVVPAAVDPHGSGKIYRNALRRYICQ